MKQGGVLELTFRALFLGVVLSVVMGAANVYLGLKAGMTVSASIPAAVIGMVLLRGLFKNGTILEANQVQTAASAGESLAAGIIFTMPALVLIGYWQKFDPVMTTIVAFTGGLLGILFMIPMRKVFIVNSKKELKFPEGVACAAVLRAGDNSEGDTGGAKMILHGLGLGALYKFSISFLGIAQGALEGATRLGGRVFFLGADVSPALVAVGYIVGLNVAILIFIGGALAWLIQIPMISGGVTDGSAVDAAWTLWSTKVRYTGVGAMVVGGVISLWNVRHGLVEAVRELRRKADVKSTDNLQRDIPSGLITALSTLAVLLVAGVYYTMTQNIGITFLITIIMIIMSFFFTAVASYIVGLVGNSNSPVSGMTITAVLFTGGLIILFGYTGMTGMAATLGVAAIVCCAACTSGDVCNDLKTGQLVGASPYRQQIMQVVGVAVASLVMAPVLQLLHDHTPGGIGGRELSAPQAALFASLAKGFFGEGTIPWNLVLVGVGIGVAFLIADQFLKAKDSEFRLHLMPIAVGMYLPFGLALPILFGGIMNHFITRNKDEKAAEKSSRPGILYSSGVIAGESLMGVGLAILASFGLTKLSLGLSSSAVVGITFVFAFVALYLFRRASLKGAS